MFHVKQLKKLSLYEKLIIENQKNQSIGRGTMDNIWIRHFLLFSKNF